MGGADSISGRELAAFGAFALLALAVGFGSYRAGHQLAGSQGAAGMSAPLANAPVNGATLYASACAGCHGAAGTGGIGPALQDTAAWTDAQFATAVLRGLDDQGRELSAVMPRFEQAGLDGAPPTAEQVAALHAFIRALKSP
ncbi:c-type cytochrome [Deinococcus koreensis]|uniref:Cytochrome c, class I n=1 Tax=Deinococcus koreensis TaxID=2054903 RepID=A0A2K3USN9_9DEIO|nr:cytochrome c [Deinococcus koreensis]PNY79556.1 cytochrome c, class I [Deinococcus koreensis]